jgi:hypothetical protein
MALDDVSVPLFAILHRKSHIEHRGFNVGITGPKYKLVIRLVADLKYNLSNVADLLRICCGLAMDLLRTWSTFIN